jgi:hypothetical protein
MGIYLLTTKFSWSNERVEKLKQRQISYAERMQYLNSIITTSSTVSETWSGGMRANNA